MVYQTYNRLYFVHLSVQRVGCQRHFGGFLRRDNESKPGYKTLMSAIAEFDHNGIRLLGFSLAGEESFVVAPELNVAFDVGRGARELISVDNVLLTHGHMDHAAGLAYYFAQRDFVDNAPGRLYAPEPLVEPIRELLRVWGRIDGHEPRALIESASPGADIELRRNLLARPFAVSHPCGRWGRNAGSALGYCVLEVRQKLKPEYDGLPGPRLVALKEQGVEITRRVELPLVSYCGDTGPGAFLELDYVRDSRVLVMECTFVDDEDKARAADGHHMHVSDLAEIVPKLRNERIVLTHLTRRSPVADARRAVRAVVGEAQMERISFLMEHRRRGPRRGAGSDAP